MQSFIEGGDEPVPKLPNHLIGVKRYATIFHFRLVLYADYKNCCPYALIDQIYLVDRVLKFATTLIYKALS